MSGPLKDRKVLVGVTGGVALYKTCELVRILVKSGAKVKCVLTESAAELISPLLFEQLSGEKAYCGMFEGCEYSPAHVSLSEWADLVVVAPCSCNTLAKLATGKTEDLLSCAVYSCDPSRTKILVCPSMNDHMWAHPVTKNNVKILENAGYMVMEPGKGELLCGRKGAGRLPEPEEILKRLQEIA